MSTAASKPGAGEPVDVDTLNNPEDLVRTGSLRGHIAWVLAQKSVGLVLSVTIALLLVRALDTAEFGYLSVGLALVGLATSAAAFSSPLQIKLLTDHADHRAHVYASTGAVVAGASIAALVALAILMAAGDWPDQTATITMVLALGMCVLPLRLLESELQADLRGVELARMRWIGQIATVTLLGLAWRTNQPTAVFAGALVAGQVIQAMILLRSVSVGRPVKVRDATPGVSEILRPAVPSLISAVAITIYLRLDQIMLGAMSSAESAGEYAAAVRLSELSYVVPIAVTFAVGSTLAAARKTGRFEDQFQSLLATFAAFAALTIAAGVLLGPTIVRIAYGPGHEMSGQILQIHVLAATFVFVGTGSSIWIVNEHRESVHMAGTIVGAFVNAGANVIVVPRYGGVGAAWTTVFSYAIASIGFNAVFPSTRRLFLLQLRAMNPFQWPIGVRAFYRLATK